MLNIREAKQADHGAIWKIFREIVSLGETYAFDPRTTEKEAIEAWIERPVATYVAELDGKVVVPAGKVRTGRNLVRVTKEGEGALYYSLLATYYTAEEPIKGASSVIGVDRRYFTVEETVDEDDRLQVKRKPVTGSVGSGTRLEVELQFTSENDFDYVMFEDYKPAGCEPVDLHSGHVWGEGLRAYREFRDEKVAFFIEHLPQGTHKLTYRVRAETPGDFHVLPNVGRGMYMTDLRCLSDEVRLVIGS